MTVKIHKMAGYTGNELGGIGANSTDTSSADVFVQHNGSVVSAATTSGALSGVSLTRATYASDNETVAKATLNYIPANVDVTYEVTITGGTITAADQGKFYNLATASTVDGTTESATKSSVTNDGVGTDPVVTMQLQMVEYVSATVGRFRIVR